MIVAMSVMDSGVTSTLTYEVPHEAVWSLLEDGRFLQRDSDIGSLISEAMSQRIRVSVEVQDLLARAHQLLSENLHLVACDVLQNKLKASLAGAATSEQ